MHNQFKTQKFKHLMLAMGPRDLNSAPYSPVHCSSHSMTSFQSSELTELPVVENSHLFAQCAHSARYAPVLVKVGGGHCRMGAGVGNQEVPVCWGGMQWPQKMVWSADGLAQGNNHTFSLMKGVLCFGPSAYPTDFLAPNHSVDSQ